MRDHDRRPSFHQPAECFKHELFRRRIKSRRRLIQNQYLLVENDSARNVDALPLSTR
jgi:hypothetical protein